MTRLRSLPFGIAALLSAAILFATAASADSRVALVIGNGAYQHADKLANPVIDARNMRDALDRLGFAVTYGEDLDGRGLRRAIGRFAGAAEGADVALVYFAGHGATFADTPYVVPVDAEFANLADMPYELVPVEQLIGELRRARGVRIAILDACRDDAAERDLKRVASRGVGVTRGLARVKDPDGLIIAYGTQYLSTASDGDPKGDSPFTAALLRHLAAPGLDVKDMFFTVANEVIATTGGRQRPEISISMYDPYMLGGRTARIPDAQVVPSAMPGTTSDEHLWSILETSKDLTSLRAFRDSLPLNNPVRARVDMRLSALESEERSTSSSLTPALTDKTEHELKKPHLARPKDATASRAMMRHVKKAAPRIAAAAQQKCFLRGGATYCN